MKVIVCGAGQVGLHLARYFANENNDVTVIDQSQELINKIGDAFDIQGIVGFASHPEVLMKAGANDAEMIIAVTQSDEVNMVACEVAHALFKTPLKIARIRHQSYLHDRWDPLFQREHVSIDAVISPEQEVAHAITKSIRYLGAFDILSVANDKLQIVGVKCSSENELINTPLKHLSTVTQGINIFIAAIIRDNETLIMPKSSDVILPGDDVFFVVATNDVDAAMKLFGFENTSSKKLLIIGGGSIGQCLADDLEKENLYSTVLIEREKFRASTAASKLNNTIVINGDGLDPDILKEAGITDIDAVIAVTDDEKVNILASLLAKRQGAKYSLCILNNMSYGPIVSSLGVDAIISPKAVTISTILQHVRKGKVKAAYPLREGFGEIMDIEIGSNNNIIGKSLESLNKENQVCVIAVMRNDIILSTTKDDIIKDGDRIILVVATNHVSRVEKLFSQRTDYI